MLNSENKKSYLNKTMVKNRWGKLSRSLKKDWTWEVNTKLTG